MRPEEQLLIQNAITKLLTEPTTTAEIIPKILQIIVEGIKWPVGQYWVFNKIENALALSAFWAQPEAKADVFLAAHRAMKFNAGEGLTGHAWSSKSPVWISDITKDTNFPRQTAAIQAGMRTALSFPLVSGDKILGVMEFYSREIQQPDDSLLKMLAVIGHQLRQFLDNKKLEKESQENEQRRAALLNAALDCIISMDHTGTIIEFNPAAEKTFGYTREYAVGKKLAALIIPPAYRKKHEEGLARYLAAGKSTIIGKRLELTGMKADGSEFPVELTVVSLQSSPVPLFTGFLRDISQRKELDRAKTVFLGNTSHELRTPLHLILGPAADALVDVEQPLPSRQLERVTLIQRNALRLLKLTNSLLDFSRIEAGRMQAAYEAVDLGKLTGEITDLFRHAIEKAGLKFIVTAPSLDEPVYVDCSLWEKIVLNLLSNAFKYTLQGCITLTLKKESGKAILVLSDTGIGIPEQELPRIFERFYRVESATGRGYEGSGIGLSLAQELVKLHGGQIQVTSKLGSGSTFTVSLPLGKAHLPVDQIKSPRSASRKVSASMLSTAFVQEVMSWLQEEKLPEQKAAEKTVASIATISESVSVSAAKPKILFAEDNADMRHYVCTLLSTYYDVQLALDGEMALQAVLADKFDLILTDIAMPKLSGIQLIRALRANMKTKYIPIILLSASTNDEERITSLEQGADDYLAKPFPARELLARIKTRLELAYLREQLEQSVRQRTGELEEEVTKHKQTEAALMKSEELEKALRKRQEQFIDTMCHELRNPLNGIYGNISLQQDNIAALDKILKSQEAKDLSPSLKEQLAQHLEQEKEIIGAIDKCARHQKTITDDVLHLSKLETGKVVLSEEKFDAKKAIEDAIAMLETEMKRKNIQLHRAMTMQDTHIYSDPNRLAQILLNLLSNAVKFTPENGIITVYLRVLEEKADTKTLQFSVEDTGIGLTAEEQAQLFNRFVQVGRRTHQEYGGSGLGLAISKNLTELMGGKIEVESQKWKGSKFTFTIKGKPVNKEEEQMQRVSPVISSKQMPTPKMGAHILVVEDNLINQKLLVRLLEAENYHCHVANNGKEAVELVTAQIPIDIILMDIEMPEMNGLEATKAIRGLEKERIPPCPRIPIVALSGNAREEHIKEAIHTGMDDYLVKPYERIKLLERIAHFTRDRLPAEPVAFTRAAQSASLAR